jgi:hypothetical protein
LKNDIRQIETDFISEAIEFGKFANTLGLTPANTPGAATVVNTLENFVGIAEFPPAKANGQLFTDTVLNNARERTGGKQFSEELASRINESEATAERAVQLLIKEGWLKFSREGRKRYLYTSYPSESDLYQLDTDGAPDLYQNEGRSVSKSGFDLYQPDTLIRSINQINNQIKTEMNLNEVNEAAERFGLKKRF